MSKRKIVMACVFLCSALVMTAAAQKGGNLPVTSVIEGTATDWTYQIVSDNGNSYYNSRTLASIISTSPGSYGCWGLGYDTSSNPRSIGIDLRSFNEYGQSSGLDAVFMGGYGLVSLSVARIIGGCNSNGQNMLDMPVQEVGVADGIIYTPLHVMWGNSNSQQGTFRIEFGPSNLFPNPSYDTPKAKITRTSSNAWTIESADNISGNFAPIIGTLLNSKGKNTGWTYYGNYNFSFKIHVTKQ